MIMKNVKELFEGIAGICLIILIPMIIYAIWTYEDTFTIMIKIIVTDILLILFIVLMLEGFEEKD